MKRIATILGLCLATAATATAQTSLVKEAEREFKANPTGFPATLNKIKPAFTNPESEKDAYTFFVPGKAAFDFYDQQQVHMQLGKNIDKKQLGLATLEGYDLLAKALPLDTVIDAKGKVKTKYSKDIVKIIANHYNDFNNSALFLWEAEDYGDAVRAWQLFVDIPSNPTFAKAVESKAPADSIFGEIYYNMGIGNSLIQNHKAAYDSFLKAISKGYTEKNAYDYAIASASELQDYGAMASVAEQAYALYGKDDSRYIGYMINNLIEQKEYAKADALLDKYLAEDPTNAQLYYVKGVVCDAEGKQDESLAAYKKAIELNPENANALMQYGYKLYQQAAAIDEKEGVNMTNSQYNEFRNTRVDPLLREAASYLEKAYQIDDQLSDARSVLRSIYYNLNDEENLKRVESM